MSARAAGSVAHTSTTVPGGESRAACGEPDHRQGTAQAPRVDDDGGLGRAVDGLRSQAAGPRARSGRDSTTSAMTEQKASTWAARSGATAASGRVIRTLPWVSAPMAARTWLGSRVLAVHADPDADGEAPAVELADEGLTVGVERRERHDVGEPGRRVADDVDVRDRRRSRPDPVHEANGLGRVGRAGRLGLLPAPRPPPARGGPMACAGWDRSAQRPGRRARAAASGCAPGPPSSPSPPGPPQDVASPARTS